MEYDIKERTLQNYIYTRVITIYYFIAKFVSIHVKNIICVSTKKKSGGPFYIYSKKYFRTIVSNQRRKDRRDFRFWTDKNVQSAATMTPLINKATLSLLCNCRNS